MERFALYVIYANPADYPGQYVGRVHTVTITGVEVAAEPFAVAATLAEVRSKVPQWLVKIDRLPDDDEAICEVWL